MQGEVVHFDSNDPKAIEQIVERYRVIAERFCFQYGVRPKEIASVVQDVFIKADQKLKKQETGTLSLWFYSLIIRTLKEYEKRQKKAKKSGSVIEEPASYGYYIEKHGHISLQNALAKLDSKYKLPLILQHYHNLKMEEISTILKMSDETITNRIQQGVVLLSENYKKAATTNHYLVDRFEDSFSDLNYSYQLLPEFTNKADIMARLEQSRKKNHWKKYVTPIGAVVGLFIFAVFGLNYMQEQKVAIEAAKEKEKTEETQHIVDGDTVNEERELNPEIAEYLEEAIDNFAIELGLEDVSEFPSVFEVKSIIYDLYQSPDHVIGNDVTQTKDYIDMMLTLPANKFEKLKAPEEEETNSLMETFGFYYNYEYYFQNYLTILLSDLTIEEYDVIYEMQDNPENYNGPEEIKNALRILDEQGYIIQKDPNDSYLHVRIDTEKIKKELVQKGYGDEYLAYFDYFVSENDVDWSNWQGYAELLLETETLIKTYGDLYDYEMRNELYTNLEHYLFGYLRYWDEVYEISEEEKKIYNSFINNHPESKVSQVIQSYLNEWEANDWKRKQIQIHTYTPLPIDLLYEYDNVKFEDIVELGRGPLVAGIGEVYKEYSSNLDTSSIINLSPIEIVALFSYAYEKEDKETYSTVIAQNSNQPDTNDWLNLRSSAGYALTEYHDDNTASIIFINSESINYGIEKVLTIELIKDNTIWKIHQIKKDSSN